MTVCVGCGSDCRNRCSRRKSHGWCAHCRDVSGSSECCLCLAEKAALMQKRKTSIQASRAAVAQSSSPVYIPAQPVPILAFPFPGQGKSLSEMDEDIKHDWLWKATEALKEKIESDQQYLQKRAAQGSSTATDLLMSKHLQVLEAILETLEQELNEFILPQPKESKFDDLLVSY